MPESTRLIEETFKLGNGTLSPWTRGARSPCIPPNEPARVRPFFRAARSEELQLQLPPGLVPEVPRFRRTVLPAGCGPRRARRRHRGILVRMAGRQARTVPGLRRHAPESRSPAPCGLNAELSPPPARPGSHHRRYSPRCPSNGAQQLFASLKSSGRAAADRPRHSARNPRATEIPGRGGFGLPATWAAACPRSPEAKASASGWPPSWAPT